MSIKLSVKVGYDTVKNLTHFGVFLIIICTRDLYHIFDNLRWTVSVYHHEHLNIVDALDVSVYLS